MNKKYRFRMVVPTPSGKDGKYVIIGSIRADASWAETEQFNAMIFRNGASNTGAYVSNGINASHGNSSHER